MMGVRRDRVEEHVRGTGWPIFLLSWLADPVGMLRWLRSEPRR